MSKHAMRRHSSALALTGLADQRSKQLEQMRTGVAASCGSARHNHCMPTLEWEGGAATTASVMPSS